MDEKAQALDAAQAAEQQISRAWTDAPNSANVRATIDGHEWQVTIRADTFKELADRITWVNGWIDKHGNGKGKNPAPANPAPIAAQVSAPIAPAAPAPATQATPQIFTMQIERMETTPRSDGKVDAKFFQAGHQYPDLTAAKAPDALVAMLAQTGQWTAAHFAAATQYPVKWIIEWVNSDKLNKNGKPYKNIVAIKAA